MRNIDQWLPQAEGVRMGVRWVQTFTLLCQNALPLHSDGVHSGGNGYTLNMRSLWSTMYALVTQLKLAHFI